jgi:hypothetical protein
LILIIKKKKKDITLEMTYIFFLHYYVITML